MAGTNRKIFIIGGEYNNLNYCRLSSIIDGIHNKIDNCNYSTIFNGEYNTIDNSDYGAILVSEGCHINSGLTKTVIIGLTDFTGTTSNTLYCNNLEVQGNLVSNNFYGDLDWSYIQNTPTTLSGYSITDAYTQTEVNNNFLSANTFEDSIDETLEALKVIEQVPLKNNQTEKELLVEEQDLTDSYADFGDEIDMEGYNKLGIYIIADCNDSANVYLKPLGKFEYGGTDEFTINSTKSVNLWSASGTTDFKTYYEFDVETVPYIQLQAYAGITGATAADLTIYINKKLIL